MLIKCNNYTKWIYIGLYLHIIQNSKAARKHRALEILVKNNFWIFPLNSSVDRGLIALKHSVDFQYNLCGLVIIICWKRHFPSMDKNAIQNP